MAMERRALVQSSKRALVSGLVWFASALTFVAAAAATTLPFFYTRVRYLNGLG